MLVTPGKNGMKKIITQEEAMMLVTPGKNGMKKLSELTGIPQSTLSNYKTESRNMSAPSHILFKILCNTSDVAGLLAEANKIKITRPGDI